MLVGSFPQGGSGRGQTRPRGRAEVEGAAEAEQVQIPRRLLPGDRGGGAKLLDVPLAGAAKQLHGEGDGGETGAIAARAQAEKLAREVEGGGRRKGGLDLSHAGPRKVYGVPLLRRGP